jgi:hypothetical protein
MQIELIILKLLVCEIGPYGCHSVYDCTEDSLLDNDISTSMTLPYPVFLLLIGLHLFGSAANIEECMQKTEPITRVPDCLGYIVCDISWLLT